MCPEPLCSTEIWLDVESERALDVRLRNFILYNEYTLYNGRVMGGIKHFLIVKKELSLIINSQ